MGKTFERYTTHEQRFKIQIFSLWINWEKSCPNLGFSVEKKMVIYIKKDDPILKLT